MRYSLGSEWLFTKFYCGPASADTILADTIAPLIERFQSSKAIHSWFFVRYADPERHLRIRFRGNPEVLRTEVLPAIVGEVETVIARKLSWRFQVDTYLPETDRYGGPVAIAHAEQVFWADSEACLAALPELRGDEGAQSRWRVALVGIDSLLTDLGFAMDARCQVVTSLRDGLRREFDVESPLVSRRVAALVRREKSWLYDLVTGRPVAGVPVRVLDAFRIRSDRVATEAAIVRDLAERAALSRSIEGIGASLVHMHMNRLLRDSHRAQEGVLYHLLRQAYVSCSSRLQRAEASARTAG